MHASSVTPAVGAAWPPRHAAVLFARVDAAGCKVWGVACSFSHTTSFSPARAAARLPACPRPRAGHGSWRVGWPGTEVLTLRRSRLLVLSGRKQILPSTLDFQILPFDNQI